MTPAALAKIFDKWRPRGWRVVYDDNLRNACADKAHKRIVTPRPTTPLRLLYGLHEFAHVMDDPWRHPSPSTMVEEFKAETLALAICRAEGVPISPQMLHHAKANVRKYRLPGVHVPAHIAEWIA